MNKKVKTIILIAAVIVVVGIVTAIAFIALNKAPANKDENSVGNADVSGSASMPAGYYPDGEKKEDNPGTVLTVNGNDISFDEYRYYFQSVTDFYRYQFGDDYFDDDEDGEKLAFLKQAVEEEIMNSIFYMEFIEKTNATLTEEEIENALQASEEDFEVEGMGFYFTDYETYKKIALDVTLSNKAANEWYETTVENSKGKANDAFEDEKDTYASVEHILLKIDDDVEVTDEGVAELKEKADEIVAEIRGSDDMYAKFKELRDEYNQDTGQPEEGYTFGAGRMMEAFYNASIELDIDDISEPVLVEGYYTGYHIIYRKELVQEHVDDIIEELAYSVAQDEFESLHDERIAFYEVSYGDYYDNINVNTVK